MSYINFQACDPTVQLCDNSTGMNNTLNGTDVAHSTGFLEQARSLTKVGLPVLGALQLSAGIATYLG